uniref:Serine/threonine protein phosphatase 2C n=1 Tax=Mycena chlorophos TaxID=658473 RepID=A0ABQ0LT65_MYCCL|nr:serine/threonine protein phosphatase 2C [Mycena chlorophos]
MTDSSDLRAQLLKSASIKTEGRISAAWINGAYPRKPRPPAEGQDLHDAQEWDFGHGLWIFAMVLDGHGNDTNGAAKFVLAEFPSVLRNALLSALAIAQTACLRDEEIAKILTDSLVALDERIKLDILAVLSDDEPRMDREIILNRAATGTTVCVALVDPSRRVHVGGIGDTECYLVSAKTQKYHCLTTLHQCSNPVERARIEQDHPREPGLFSPNGILKRLALSRAIGDFALKLPAAQVEKLLHLTGETKTKSTDPVIAFNLTPPYVINTPEISHIQAEEGDHLVLASDGLDAELRWRHRSDMDGVVGRVCAAGVAAEPMAGYNSALEILWQAWMGAEYTHLHRLVTEGESPAGRVDDITILVARI